MQNNYSYPMQPHAIYSNNIGVNITSAFEFIVIDDVPITAITNFALTIKNNSSSGNITGINVYFGPDGSIYTPIITNLFGANIAPLTTQHKEFTGISRFIRITAKADSNINIDVYLHGNLT